jgi:DNA-binding NarL/FixJ family response regulator
MAALLGDQAGATEWFATARRQLEASDQRPLLAIADFDEAKALLLRRAPDIHAAAALLDSATAEFRALGMSGWEQRAAELRASRNVAPPARPASPAGITPREEEVLRLIAAGRTTREIAEELVLSPGTVERHITNLYGKIGARGRADATTFALRHGLVIPETP